MPKLEQNGLDLSIREPVVLVQFDEVDPENIDIQNQPFRNRSVVRSAAPDLGILAVQFYKNEDNSSSNVDLSDLILGPTGITEEELALMLEDNGINVIRSKPRYVERRENNATLIQELVGDSRKTLGLVGDNKLKPRRYNPHVQIELE